jgi:uncharacterized protein YutE (UPF0331/DUF86 family)
VPVRPEIVRRKLVDVESTVSRLQTWLPITVEQLEGDLMLQWAVERGLHIAAEALFDACAHILADDSASRLTSIATLHGGSPRMA